jgi:choline dehydrogenase
MTPSSTPSIVADYVIIGAGSAGCVLANRLSADPAAQVVLLEAGGDDRPRHRFRDLGSALSLHYPAGFAGAMTDPKVTWPYLTEPDRHTHGREHFWPRGRVLGGSSSINGLLYVRGQREDYDGWRQLGCTGWSWDDVEPCFRRIERRRSDPSDDGAVHICDPADRHPVSIALVEACERAGIPRTGDYNGSKQEGAGWFQTTMLRGRRHSAASAYLHPVTKRSNLRVVSGSAVRRILFEGRRAVGAEIDRGDRVEVVRARREVVLSAGAVNSPQLLLLSGIGPADDLRALGIDVVRNAAEVGRNLQDHYTLYNEFVLRPGVPSINTAAKRPVRELLRYAFGRTGLLASAAADVAVFLRSDPAIDLPDVQFHGLPGSLARGEDGRPVGVRLDERPGLTLTGCQLRPESRGAISLRSAEPRDTPVIRPNYLSAERDQAMAVIICTWARRIAAQPPLVDLIASESFPGSEVTSPDEVLEWACRSGGSVYHPVGSCRMGGDPESVVDARLKVRGVEGLRIADASIMPRIVSGNTNAASMMIGERASELIRDDAMRT